MEIPLLQDITVIAIPDPVATRHIVQLARELNPKVHLIARTCFVRAE